MDRRNFIALIGGAATAFPLASSAQQRPLPKIGMLWHAGSAEEEGPYFIALMKGFADLGYVDGKTAHFEHRYADERYERFPAMARELMAPDVHHSHCLRHRVGPGAERARRQPGAARTKPHRHVQCHG
jgi:hypothetical protein